MSRHHVEQKWSTHAPKLRKIIEAQIKAQGWMPCVNCGRPVTIDHRWQVGHRQDAAAGGPPTIENVGPVHVRSSTWPLNCNQIAGGRLGARIANANRTVARQREQDIRPW